MISPRRSDTASCQVAGHVFEAVSEYRTPRPRCRVRAWLSLLLWAFVVCASPASAQTQTTAGSEPAGAQPPTGSTQPPPPDTSKEKKPKDQAGKNKASKEKSSKKKKDKSAKKEDGGEASDSARPAKHPTWQPMPGIRLDFKTRVETESRPVTPPASLEQGPIEWQDRRVGVEGTLFKRFSFEVSHEFGRDFEEAHDLSEKSAWKEAFVRARVNKAFAVDAGRFKLPFGREELVGETNRDFAYKSLAARVLSPGRDIGVMAHGRLFDRRAEYQVGYFARDGENGRTSQTLGGTDAVAARFVVSPFRREPDRLLAPLELGVNVETSHLDNRLGIRGRTVLGDGIFFERLYMNGARRRIGFDAGWESGPFSLSTEYITLSEERRGMGYGGADLPGVYAHAWYAAWTWALTGERKHGRLEPARDLSRSGFGAFELAVRTEALRFDMAELPEMVTTYSTSTLVSANADHATTIGVNWYMNHYVKLESDLVLESIDDPARSPSPATGGRFVTAVFLLQFHF
jgi:phosphate-selective porin